MQKNNGSFQCPKCKTPYRTQDEARRCGLRKNAVIKHEVGAIVRYTFFFMTDVGRDQSEDFNKWRVVDPAVSIVPDREDGHEYMVQVQQLHLKHPSKERATHVLPSSKLI